jgi:ABC-type transport system involved in multi-copper enzyme maturation permease subunit
MKNILLIISNTFQKEIRSKTLIFLSLMTLGVIVGLNTLLNFLGEKVLSDLGMGQAGGLAISGVTLMIGMWCYFLCSFLIVDTIRSDFEKGVTSLLMTLPIKRFEYLMGRVLGIWCIVACFYFVTSSVAFYLFNSTTKMSFSISLLGAFAINLLSYLAMIAIGLLISLYFKKLTGLAICMVCSFFIHSSNTYFMSKPISDVFSDFEIMKFIGASFHQLLPRIGVVSTVAKAILLDTELQINYLMESFHYIASLTFLLLIIRFLFKRKNL